jgi:hypothetical protein
VTTSSGTGLAGIEMSFIGVAARPRRGRQLYSSPGDTRSAKVTFHLAADSSLHNERLIRDVAGNNVA